MTTTVYVHIRGSIVRPSYDGVVKLDYLPDPRDRETVHARVVRRLRSTSFPEIRGDDVVIERVEVKYS